MKSGLSPNSNPQVRIVSEKTSMKFRPLHTIQSANNATLPMQASEEKKSSALLGWFRKDKQPSKSKNTSAETTATITEHPSRIQNTSTSTKSKPLRFLQKLSTDYVLIGNQHQLDAFGVGHISKYGFVQTQYCWSIHLKKRSIDLVAVDSKKNNLVIIISGQFLYAYQYDVRKMNNQPTLIQKEMDLKQVPRFIQITRDSTISIVFNKKLQIYTTHDQVKKKFSKPYEFPDIPDAEQNFTILMVPEAYQTILNIFFQEVHKNLSTFGLWCLEVQFLPTEIKLSPLQKIYDIKNSLRKSLRLTNYSRDIFLMNLGSEVYALKKGYILDTANVNLKHEESKLYYLGQNNLLHVSSKKIQLYNFMIKTASKPFHIKINPRDSIQLNKSSSEDKVIRVIEILNNQFALFLQKKNQYSQLKNQQVQYCFYITRPISRKQKIDSLFPRQNFHEIINHPSLAEKCDIAEKMGLSRKQIYYELWMRSERKSEQDYRLLISTKDYRIIEQEVFKKLKKASMSFKEVKRIEDECFDMLEEMIFSTQCTQQIVQDYISCHFFRRKLDMLRDLYFMGEKGDRHEKLKLSIQEYQSLKFMDIKLYLKQLIQMMCEQGKMKYSVHIRLLLINFKFVFRTIYKQILESIILGAKNKLIILLREIPEILPFEYQEVPDSEVKGLFDGVWPQITEKEWRESLYVDNITTIDNKEVILNIVVKGLWFRRNWLTHHDMAIDSKAKINKTWEEIRTPQTFYFFIEKVFQEIQDEAILREVMSFIEQTYKQKMPKKIIGKVFLLHEIYQYLKNHELLPLKNNKPRCFSEFLQLQTYEIYRHFFIKERSLKGLLLMEIKPLCERVCEEGSQIFNKGLLEYFSSDLSEISDLKYILNRINNKKKQFHQENQQMYEILVEALERKLKIGTDSDIPIEEVLIYIDNIPLKVCPSKSDQQCKALQELKSVEKINSEIQTLRKAKLNMTLYEILHQQEDVLTKLVNSAVESEGIMNIDESEEAKNRIESFTYKFIASLEHLSEEIYEEPNSYNIFFIYMSKLCEKQEMIQHAKHLLHNEYLIECYEEETAEHLVQYMYRWKLFNNTAIVKSADYINQLLTLIPTESSIHQYISSELEFARLLSLEEKPVQYPISVGAPTIIDLKNMVERLPVSHVIKIDIPRLHEVTSTMQRIVNEEFNDPEQIIGEKPVITLHQTFEVILMKLIQERKLKEALPLIRRIMEIPIPDPTYNIVYIIFFVMEISPELNEENKSNLIDCILHYFYDAWGLLEVVEGLIYHPYTTTQRKDFIESSLKKGKQNHGGFNPSNKIFNTSMVEVIMGNKVLESNFLMALQKTTQHLQHTKQQFRKVNYAALMAMMYNSPYALAKYIHCKDNLNLKYIRSFLSYIIKEEVFDPLAVLELGRRIFLIILYTMKEGIPIQMAIDHYSAVSLDQNIQVDFQFEENNQNDLEIKIWKSAEAFKKKKEAVKSEIDFIKEKEIEQSVDDRRSRYQSEFMNVPLMEERQPAAYPFRQIDSDDENQNEEYVFQPQNPRQSKASLAFHAQEQREKLLKRGKNPKLFMSTKAQPKKQSFHNFSKSIKLKIKNSNTLLFENFLQLEKSQPKTHSDRSKKKQIQDDFELRNSDVLNIETPSLRQRKYSAQEEASSSPEIRTTLHAPMNQFDEERPSSDQLKVSFNNNSSDIKPASEVSNPYKVEINPCESEVEDEVIENSEEKEMKEEEQEVRITLKDSIEIKVQGTGYQDEINSIQRALIQANREALLDSGQPQYDLSPLDKIKDDVVELRSFIKLLYENSELAEEFQRLNIIKLLMMINLELPLLSINPDTFKIYYRAEDLQTKLCLDLPFCEIFVTDGLFRKFTSNQQLFRFINPYVQRIIDDGNVYKVAKFLSLVFSNISIENDIFYQYLWTLISQNSELSDPLEVRRVVEKISVLVNKLEIKTLNENFESLYNHISQSAMKEKVLAAVSKSVKQKQAEKKEQKIAFFTKLLEKDANPQHEQMLKALQC